MLWVALTLGFFGSVHCIGMCGPLAIAFCNKPQSSKFKQFINALNYNLGRTVSYALFGLLFGALGSFLFLVDLQKYLSIAIGAILISYTLLNVFNPSTGKSFFSKINFKFKSLLATLINKSKSKSTFTLGILNGFLPCGLVYLAIAGALASPSIQSGVIFMILFGLGTIPAMFLLILGTNWASPKMRISFQKVLPYVNLIFGLFLIYRGVVVDMPDALNFWEAVKNPIMCH